MMCTRVGKLIYIPQLSMNLPSDALRLYKGDRYRVAWANNTSVESSPSS